MPKKWEWAFMLLLTNWTEYTFDMKVDWYDDSLYKHNCCPKTSKNNFQILWKNKRHPLTINFQFFLSTLMPVLRSSSYAKKLNQPTLSFYEPRLLFSFFFITITTQPPPKRGLIFYSPSATVLQQQCQFNFKSIPTGIFESWTGNTDKGKYRSILNVYSVLINNGVLFFATDLHLSIYLNFGQNSFIHGWSNINAPAQRYDDRRCNCRLA